MRTLVRAWITWFVCLIAPATLPQLLADTVGSLTGVTRCYTTAFNQSVATGCAPGSMDVEFGVVAQTSLSGSVSLDSSAEADLTGTASADAGVLKGSITTTVTSGAPPVLGVFGEADSLVVDTVTISDPSPNGQTGSLVLGLSADATGSGAQLVSSEVYTDTYLSLYAGAFVQGFPLARTVIL
jgi:hypothetical protein